MSKSKGFTLIELLVVIAIIGLLSTIVVASLTSARTRGADAAVKANLANIRAQAENYYDTNTATPNSFGVSAAACTAGVFSDTVITNALAQITANRDTTGGAVACTTSASGQKWAIYVPLLKGGGSWCVDNSGYSGSGKTSSTLGVCS